MYSVLIVDDELSIREGLVTLLDWESLGYRVVDTAANAVEARHKAKLYSPDLMIVDIRMPGKDGLELIGELREDHEELHILILSGYADFSYAKRALSYNIDNYLLKPVDEEELQLYLTGLSTVLNARQAHRKNHEAVKVWSREMLVQSLLMESSLHPAPALMESALEAGLLWDSYQIVLIRLLLQDSADNGPSSSVKSRLTSSFEDNRSGIVFALDSYLGVLLQPSYQKELVSKRMAGQIREAAAAEGLECIITAGDMVDSLTELQVSHQSALARMKDHFFYDEPGMIGPDSLKLKQGMPANPQDTESRLTPVMDRLYFALDTGNLRVITALIQEAGDLMAAAGSSEMAVKSYYVRAVTSMSGKLSVHYKELSAAQSRMEEQIQQIYRHTSLPQLQRYISGLLEEYAAGIIRDDIDVLMKRMVDLIHRHYDENLKLETLADVFTYSSAYLGKLFKNTMGCSFNTYLDTIRIEKAKELLDQGCKIHQAASSVGFSDVDYFREKFKKITGISPSAYRRKEPENAFSESAYEKD
ncbi:response regulator transcription factor [Paenibacillus sp. FSL P4-0338]|uniref:response regulator transcription factor n=1 Tax=unclassified Paenibacillus TaxID=185978 RepID=UPI0003E22347|nr:response regulator transcription factor [Paenibacillus sp. FSL R7-269]ETT44407.1 two component AraC family transcriptional regulator [Paenibacillus sp. FSL R7-269]